MAGLHKDNKILVGEIPDPVVGVWREITHPVKHKSDLDGWLLHMVEKGNDTAVVQSEQGFTLLASKKAATN